MRRTGPYVMAVVLAALAVVVRAEQPDRNLLFEVWHRAVTEHVPGQADAPATTIAEWSKELLLAVLNHSDMDTAGAFRRGAVLHLDIALQGTARAEGRLFPSYPRNGPGPPPQALIVVDGTWQGLGFSGPHLEFARALIAKLDAAAKASFGVRWYTAAAAELARRGNNADLWYHLEHAKLSVPDSAELLLASGCLHELFAGPMAQSARRNGQDVRIGDKGQNLVRADEYFSRALAKAPDFVEARLRRGRVRGLINRHAEAVLDLQRARELTTDHAQSYYIRLFLGREEELLGRYDEAREHFEAAAALFPRAQSPWLSLSRLASYRGDASGARQAIAIGLRSTPSEPDSEDPWWIYDLGPGRYAATMLQQVYGLAAKEGS